MEIKKIRKQGDLKIITIPKYSDLNIGDYVVVEKLVDPKLKLKIED